jgi:ubiquinone/menaquinone biosynthesis C-methylase UbiE
MTFFNTIADEYDDWYETKLGQLVDTIETQCGLSLLEDHPGQKYLDAGCGTGNFTQKLTDRQLTVVGIDSSDQMLSIARAKVKDAEFHQMNFYDLSFDDNTFDGIFSMAAFEFVKEPKKALDELMRVLKPGGELIVGTINPASPWGGMYKSQIFEDSIFQYAIFYTKEELMQYYPGLIRKTKECLYIPPTIDEEAMQMNSEKKYKKINAPGFYFIKWTKK